MFVKIVATIIIVMAVVMTFVMFSFDGLTFIGGAPGLVTGITPFLFMIPARIRNGSLYAEYTKQ